MEKNQRLTKAMWLDKDPSGCVHVRQENLHKEKKEEKKHNSKNTYRLPVHIQYSTKRMELHYPIAQPTQS